MTASWLTWQITWRSALRIFGLGALFFLVQLGYVWGYLPYMEGTTGQTIGKKSQRTEPKKSW